MSWGGGGFPCLPPPKKALSCSTLEGGGLGTNVSTPKLPLDVSNGRKVGEGEQGLASS